MRPLEGTVDESYFGYGSLVNRHTRVSGRSVRPGYVTGWVRQWKHCSATPFGNVCALTVTRRPGVQIDGVFILDDAEGMAAVDRREDGYERVRLEPGEVDASFADLNAFMYVSSSEYTRWGDEEFPILRSYLDCVLAGYIDVWGPDGARHFIQTTEGWQVPIFNDREMPKYPRAVALDEFSRSTIDDLLKQNGIVCSR
ncbi:MAG TPA: gamma-glutamylcyclotransferase family protein [Bryobacteraceae bacterium]|nr:gamma-glutamylcyclotransferase family protein [Bryobacteraceae bacterium]